MICYFCDFEIESLYVLKLQTRFFGLQSVLNFNFDQYKKKIRNIACKL